MVLGEAYKESSGMLEGAVNRSVLLRCRHQLGQLRENDETIVHALNQVLASSANSVGPADHMSLSALVDVSGIALKHPCGCLEAVHINSSVKTSKQRNPVTTWCYSACQ